MAPVDQLLEWAGERGIELNGILPKRLPGRGVGVIATRSIKADEVVLEVPTSSLRSIDTVPKVIRSKLPKDITVHGLLAADLALDTISKYIIWNAVCPSPEDFASMPLLWPASLQPLLPGPAKKLLSKQQAKLAKDWAAVSAAFPDLDEDRYTYGWLLANTRTFYYLSPTLRRRTKEDRMVLQPVADLFNHADEGCKVNFDAKSFVVQANRVYEKDEEVRICYGRHGGDFLMVEYGFVMDENQWDEVGLDEVVLPELDEKQREMLEDRGFLGGYVLDQSQVCYRTQVAMRTLCCNSRQWTRFVDGMDDGERSQGDVNKRLVKLLENYRGVIKRMTDSMKGMEEGEVEVVQTIGAGRHSRDDRAQMDLVNARRQERIFEDSTGSPGIHEQMSHDSVQTMCVLTVKFKPNMAPPASVLSRTLQSISVTKTQEIEKQRARYEECKNGALEQADQFPNDPHKRIARLARGLLDLYPEATHDQKVKNIKYWLQQARYDASVPAEMLHAWEEVLRSKLEVQSRKLGLAHLYSQLVTEWMNPANPIGEVPVVDDASFEIVDRQKERLQELCDKFERVVFEPLETDEVEIDLFMSDLFEGDEASKSLEGLRRQMQYAGESLMTRKNPFDIMTLKWCLRGLLAEDLLSDEKQVILRDFLENEMALKEIGDVLNMRYADFDSWQWQAGKDGIPILPRQQLNGKYRIWMDEDVLQAIFIEFVGIQCCIKVKPILRDLIDDSASWKWTTGTKPRTVDRLRRENYTNESLSRGNTVNLQRKSRYIDQFFLSQLPGSVNALGSGTYVNDGAGSEDEGDKKAVQNIKQELLRTIATEVLLGRRLSGSVVVIQSDLKWYATGLSHNTIFAVMRFFGLPDKLIAFYRKVIAAPLNMTPASDRNGPRDPKTRRRGVPMAHATEKFIGELILFVMDLVVNRETGLLLYRLHDDLFLCGEPARHTRDVAGLWLLQLQPQLKTRTVTGSVYLTNDEISRDPSIQSSLPSGPVEIGHLLLDPKSGEWVIDQKQVQTWNSCIGQFFSHTFGEPAFCLGPKHLDSILETYEHMQTVLFSNAAESTKGDHLGSDTAEPGNVVQYLKARIEERFGVSDIPNAFIFLPEQLGGLGVRNPFIPMLVLRESLCEPHNSPQDIIEAWLIDEKETYLELKKSFYELPTVEDRLRRCRAPPFTTALKVYKQGKASAHGNLSQEELETFFSYEEYFSTREDTSRSMLKTYQKLIATPSLKEPDLHEDVAIALSDLRFTRDNGSMIAQQAMQRQRQARQSGPADVPR
ncbi:hypothetical protein SCUP234_01447 [Seiridium cupressi]